MRISVVGLWHLGCVTAACLADDGHQVIGVDQDQERVARLRQGIPPLHEPGLADLIQRGLESGRLSFSSDIRDAAARSECAWLTVDTPIDENDRSDLSLIWRAVDALATALPPRGLLLVSSQVPVGTCAEIVRRLKRSGTAAEVAYIPENLRLGLAIERFRRPNMLVIGARSAATAERVKEILRPDQAPVLVADLETAEMTKHAINAFLATSISFANELSGICEQVGADAAVVAAALRLDERVGPKARVDPGLGFAGGTLARDLRTLEQLGESYGTPTALVRAVLEVNERQMGWVERTLLKRLGALTGRLVAVLGLTYTPNTSTLRRSAAMAIIAGLVRSGARVRAHDPGVDPKEIPSGILDLVADPHLVAQDADALVLITDWSSFRDLDYQKIRRTMRRPLLLDTKRMLDPSGTALAGWEYAAIGMPVHA